MKVADNWKYPWPLLGSIVINIPILATLVNISYFKMDHFNKCVESSRECWPLNGGISQSISHPWRYEPGCIKKRYNNSWYIDNWDSQSSGTALIVWLDVICWLRLLVIALRLSSEDYSYRSGIVLRIRAEFREIDSFGMFVARLQYSFIVGTELNTNSSLPSFLR